VRLFTPIADSAARADAPLEFTWLETEPGELARIEIEAEGKRVFGAVVRGGTGRYVAPPFLGAGQQGKALRWRVVAVDGEGRERARSAWQALRIE
jgi:hypothetical protein